MSQKTSSILLPENIKKYLPATVRNELSKMPAHKQEEFIEEYKRKAINLAIAYLFFIFGIHYLYLKQISTQLLFWFTFGGGSIWWFIDIFRMPSLVGNYNKDIAIDTLRNLKMMSI